jgi:hypothetical protein
MEIAKADVIKASCHPRFRLVGVEHYLLPGSTQPMPPPTTSTRIARIWINQIPGCA